MVHAFEDRHRVRLRVAKVERDVGELVLLLQRNGQTDVLTGVHHVGLPAGDVVRVVQIGQEVRRMRVLSLPAVAQVAFTTIGLAAEPEK